MDNLSLTDVLTALEQLSNDRQIRPLDYQFARFISQFESQPLVVLAAALASYHSGQGDVCVWISRLANSPLFGLSHYEQGIYLAKIQLNQQQLQRLTNQLSTSKVQGTNAPLVLDNGRLYLQRFWLYEQQISQFLHQRSASVDQVDIDQIMAHLFQLDYRFIWSKLTALREKSSNSQSSNSEQPSSDDLRTFCHDFFNIRPDLAIDTSAIEQILINANSVEDIAQAHQLVAPQHCINWQQIAVAIASHQRFSVISGGPGTGKTTTVTKLLALLVELHAQQTSKAVLKDECKGVCKEGASDAALKIELVAPTGKAAARLTESITDALTTLDVAPQIKSLIPSKASTIHRLLGVIPKRQEFKHNSDNPLHLDVLIVDEASMVDISLMAKLLSAVPEHAKLILLGDKDQLASVEAGAVFADICQGLSQGPSYSAALTQWLTTMFGYDVAQLAPPHSSESSVVSDSLCLLQKSYRFGEHSGIGQLAKAINQGDLNQLKKVWQHGYSDICLYSGADQSLSQLTQLVVNGYRAYLKAAAQVESLADVAGVLRLFNKFQLLSPLRQGNTGIDALNLQIESKLSQHQFIELSQGSWYVGRPVMVQQNDYQQQLFNGDVGIVLPDVINPDVINSENSQLRVYFKMADGEIKSFLPSRLPKVDTVYAMTIHKSQGSEFDHVVMVLPNTWSPLLTKELVYTGVTRAKSVFDLFSPIAVLKKSTISHTQRSSGLSTLLKTV